MSIIEMIASGKRNHQQARRNKAMKNAALGAAVGVLVGAAGAALLTPKPGKETRADICQAAQEMLDKAKQIVEKKQAGNAVSSLQPGLEPDVSADEYIQK